MRAGKPAAGKPASGQSSKPGGKAGAALPEAPSAPCACVGDLEAAAALWVQRWAEHAEPATCAAAVNAAMFELSAVCLWHQITHLSLEQALSTERHCMGMHDIFCPACLPTCTKVYKATESDKPSQASCT